MTALPHTLRDTATMLRRNLRRQRRYASVAVFTLGGPIVFLLLFVYVFGGTLGDGLPGAGGGRGAYLDYLTPGILVLGLAGAAQAACIAVAMDMTEGIIDRFRTMAISRASVLNGHVTGSLIQMLAVVAVVLVVALLLGFRPQAGAVDWLGFLALVVLVSLGIAWLAVAMGLAAKSVESASNLPSLLLLLPFLGSGFVPTDSMPTALRLFAEHQPFTSVIEALRGLLTGSPAARDLVVAAAWSVAAALFGYLWARRLYDRPRRT